MKLKRIICTLLSLAVTLMCTVSAYAGTNWDSADADSIRDALDGNNVWEVYTDSGTLVPCAEGLRVTVYDADNEHKVYNTIDITGNSLISAVSDLYFFADGTEPIPKTTWLDKSYIGNTYNAIDSASVTKYHNAVARRIKMNGYKSQYVPSLASLTIISEDNTENLEAIRALIGEENFLKNLCDLIGGLTYDDFADGKYKIAFEPVGYFTFAGVPWALTATECGILDKYMLDIMGSTTGALKSKLGPLTHSQMPLAAFLSYKELGISAFSTGGNDITYSDSGAVRYTNSCIIRCMGIGVLSGIDGETDLVGEAISEVQYHTDTEVYTSFDFVNIGSTDYIAANAFSIYNSDGETPKTYEAPVGDQYVVGVDAVYDYDEDGNVLGIKEISNIYAYDSNETEMQYTKATESIKVFAKNPRYGEDFTYGKYPYTEIGRFKDGQVIKSTGGAGFDYVVKGVGDKTIATGTIYFSCPAEEEAMGWFAWKTPSKAQNITITLTAKDDGIQLVSTDGQMYSSITLNASVTKVEEITPHDPKVTDKRPSWQKIYNAASVEAKIADYAAEEDATELTWYVWAYDWYQHELDSNLQKIRYITSWWGEHDYTSWWSYYRDKIDNELMGYWYHINHGYGTKDEDVKLAQEYETYEYWSERYGVDNSYYDGKGVYHKKQYVGAVVLSGEAHKVEYSVSLSADMVITPSEHCYTATYNGSTDRYTMKSGYGFEIEVTTHLSGDTSYCTGSQNANVLFPEFNYNLKNSADYNRLLEKVGRVWVFKENEYSTYEDRVHFTPIWYPDNSYYTVFAEVFDVWCPAGQLSVRMTDTMIIRGNVYDDWHVAPVKP